MIVSQPGPDGWNARDLSQVEDLLQLQSYPPCAAVTVCLERWQRFAHQGEGYREGPPMPGGEVELTFNDESWDDPEPNNPSPAPAIGGAAEAVVEREDPAAQGDRDKGGEDASMLRERWQLTHGIDPPDRADKGFAGIRDNMERRAAETEGILDEVTLYCPLRDLEL